MQWHSSSREKKNQRVRKGTWLPSFKLLEGKEDNVTSIFFGSCSFLELSPQSIVAGPTNGGVAVAFNSPAAVLSRQRADGWTCLLAAPPLCCAQRSPAGRALQPGSVQCCWLHAHWALSRCPHSDQGHQQSLGVISKEKKLPFPTKCKSWFWGRSLTFLLSINLQLLMPSLDLNKDVREHSLSALYFKSPLQRDSSFGPSLRKR